MTVIGAPQSTLGCREYQIGLLKFLVLRTKFCWDRQTSPADFENVR